MNTLKRKLINPIHEQITRTGISRNNFYLFCIFWVLVAVLEFTQDIISASLNSLTFEPGMSVAFKTFWLLFIPFSWGMILVFNRIWHKYSSVKFFFSIPLILFISFLHLFIFALILHLYSGIVHSEAWSIYYLIVMKLSTRLYIVLTANTLLAIIFITYKKRKKSMDDQKSYSEVIPVKMGIRSLMVNTEDIMWIESDEGYNSIQTKDRKYLVSTSLKELINDLDPHKFKRIHKSTIINTGLICELKSRRNGDYDVLLQDGSKFRLSRNYTDSLKGTWL